MSRKKSGDKIERTSTSYLILLQSLRSCTPGFAEGQHIPKTTESTKAGRTPVTGQADELKQQKALFDLERQKLEMEKERSLFQSESERQRAEAERDLLRALLEEQKLQGTAPGVLKNQQDLLGKIFSKLQGHSHRNPGEKDVAPGYIAELIGFHALKRVSSDITRALAAVVGLGTDVRIMIVDQLEYADGDVPLIEVTSHLSVLEVRCRKQIATNKELAELVTGSGESGDEEKTATVKTGLSRLGPLTAGPFVLPVISAHGTPIPEETGLVGTAADSSSSFRGDYSLCEDRTPLKTRSLVAAVAGALRSEKRNVYVYNFYALDTTGPQSKLMNMYAGMLDCSSRLAQSRNRLLYFIRKKNDRLKELQSRVKKSDEQDAQNPQAGPEAEGLTEEAARVREWLDRANPAILASDAIHTELGTFVKNITAENPAGGSKLAQAVYREKVRDLGITHLLYLNVASSGGETVTRKWVWGSGDTSYFGGAVISYILSRVQGDVLVSDTLPVLYTMEFDPSGRRNSPLRQVRFERPEPKK